jgi:hypothetical protein
MTHRRFGGSSGQLDKERTPMDNRQTLKQRLPFPYDQDLSQVISHVDRRTPHSRKRLANDPVTAAYLAAAMRLIERHLGPGATRKQIDPEDENSVERPLLSFLSQRTVAAEVANNPNPFPRVGNVSTMRSTWKSQSDFIADLLSFALWSQSRPDYWESQEMQNAIARLMGGAAFTEAVHDLAYWNMVIFVSRPRFRLELVAAAAVEGDDIIRDAMVEHYRGAVEPWKHLLDDVLEARGLRLRRGIEADDFVNALAAVAEGMALRAIAEPAADIVDHGRQKSLLGTVMLGLIRSFLERSDDGDGTTLEEAVSAWLNETP